LTQNPPRNSKLLILLSVLCTALAYFGVGLPLAVLPGWVHNGLGYSAVIAGLAISLQYVATIVSRGFVGPMVDTSGPRRSILLGFACCCASGALLMVAGLLTRSPALALTMMLLSRILLGFAESWVGTSSIAWAIGRTGPENTARIISWNGIATYGAIAIGAPAGVWLFQLGTMPAVGTVLLVTGACGFAFAWPQPATQTVAADRLPYSAVVARVLPYGMALAAGAIGFGVIAAFIALYYSERDWSSAWIALSGFGVAFVAARLLFVDSVARHGGLKVAILFLSIEAAGLATIWLSAGPLGAIVGAATTGFGFAMLFPALGMIVVDLVPPQNRGAAIGAYSMFTDIALCITGPVAGILAADVSYASPFLFGALAALFGLVLVFTLARRQAVGASSVASY